MVLRAQKFVNATYGSRIGMTVVDDGQTGWNTMYALIVTRSLGSGRGVIEVDINIATMRDKGQASFNPAAAQALDNLFDTSCWPQLLADVQSYMESIGFPEGGGRISSTIQCLETIIAGDVTVSSTAPAYGMRKALIQTTAFWEFRHYGNEDLIKNAGVWLYHNGYVPGWAKDPPGVTAFRDSSTGVAQMFGFAGILAWSNSINTGLVTGTPKDRIKDSDVFGVWDKIRTGNDFALTGVGHAQIRAAEGTCFGTSSRNSTTRSAGAGTTGGPVSCSPTSASVPTTRSRLPRPRGSAAGRTPRARVPAVRSTCSRPGGARSPKRSSIASAMRRSGRMQTQLGAAHGHFLATYSRTSADELYAVPALGS
ncbi:hypothetical protein ACWD3I_47935 [Streptomyces sp. NPDC002817]|uniref:hypothetical protein n=1 Tax=Streptomyces sp. NPDC088357 TaxID=3154655 RepID=UPI003424BBBF